MVDDTDARAISKNFKKNFVRLCLIISIEGSSNWFGLAGVGERV